MLVVQWITKINAYLCIRKVYFTTLLSKPMDSTLPSNPYHLFAYCITDGILDEMSPEQRTSIIRIIESMLLEREYTIIESMLSEGENTPNKTK